MGECDKLLLTLIYRHGLRVSEAVDLRWSKDSVHTFEPDTVHMLERLHAETSIMSSDLSMAAR